MRRATRDAAGTPPSRLGVAGALAILYLVWGSTYLGIRVMVETVPPLLGAGARFVLAGALLYAWVGWRRGIGSVTRRELAGAALVGTLLMFGGNGLVTVAERDVPSGLAALLVATEPLWVVGLRRLGGERVPRVSALGIVAGFIGVALLLAPGQRPAGASLAASLLVVFAAMCWATGSYAGSRLALPRDPMHSAALQMLIGGAAMLVVAVPAGEPWALDLSAVSGDSALAFAYLVVAGSIVALSAYTWLLRHVPISTVSTYAYVNPVIAVFLGWLVLSEDVTTATAGGAAIIVLSVAFTMRQEGTAREAEPAPAPGGGAHGLESEPWTSAGRTASDSSDSAGDPSPRRASSSETTTRS